MVSWIYSVPRHLVFRTILTKNDKNPFKANGQPHVLGYEGDAFSRRVGASRRSLE